MSCPFPIKGDDGTIKQCIERGHCGCDESKKVTMPDVMALAKKIANCPGGYTQESVEVAKAYTELQSKVDELLERQREACADAYSRYISLGCYISYVRKEIRNAKIGGSDDL